MTSVLRAAIAALAITLPVAAAAVVPTGARVDAGGFATILSAPPDPAAVAAARMPAHPPGPTRHWYAAEHGISDTEARARLAAQARLQPAFIALNARLRREQNGNFIGAMLRHDPDWAYVFTFKRNPAQTLARYTREPRFEAALGRYSEQERAALIEPWEKRWTAEAIPFGYGLDAVYPTMEVELGMTAQDWQALSAARGWGQPPAPIVLKFAKAPSYPALDPRVRPFLKGFATESRPTLIQLTALRMGTLKLKSGCLMIERGAAGPDQVAVFHQETGIGIDSAGYLALIDRTTGEVRGRVGEKLAWGAPNAIPKNGMVGLDSLRAACPGELINIGNPESAAAFDARNSRRPVAPARNAG